VLGGRLIVEALELAACGGLTPTPQPQEGVTYARKIEKAEAAIDWGQSAAVIERRIRAFDPFPGAQTALNGESLKVWRAQELTRAPGGGTPGRIVAVNSDGLDVDCGEGCLRVTELQRSGGKRLPVADFLRGFDVKAGMKFESAGS
jgi:methionyl-tRNA formyltransferase